jgi:peptide/nickel transport system ATP-binding protein
VVHQASDRVAVLRGGTLLELGTTAQVFVAPAHSYTRDLLEAVPRLPARAAPT